MLSSKITDACISILEEELLFATGCTEPIAVAYAAAKLRDVLGTIPEKVLAEISGNILKNVKSVVVPNTGGLRGVKAAIAAGIIAGSADKELQVITDIAPQNYPTIAAYCQETPIDVVCPDTPRMLDIRLTGWSGADSAIVHIANNHNNIIYIAKNETVLLEKSACDSPEDGLTDKSFLTLQTILDFANEVEIKRVAPLLDRQIQHNIAIAEEGLRNDWGANIGSVLLQADPRTIRAEAKAWAAAGSDARMSGCDMPVVIVSGSGNQGITASVPVIRYAKHLQLSQEQLYRALLVSNLVTVYQKRGIGRLSAYCGAVSAGVGVGAAVAYMHGSEPEVIAQTIINAVAMISGTICDGAKPSCAAKIAAGVEAGLLGYEMCRQGQGFRDGDGIVGSDVDITIANIGILAQQGMRQTDRVILEIMNQSH